VLFAGLIRGIVHDAPIATGLSLLGVIVLVALFDRTRRGVALVIGALVVGVVWMAGAAAWLGVRVNFLNFIALPISFGIGVDYGINMYRRCALEGPGGIGRAVRAVGGALVLCSSTTVIGYGALLVADNQALRSFGAMAILGEVATLFAAITMLPAALVVRRRAAGPGPAG
jgi:predicted RND superfamily exporter protein